MEIIICRWLVFGISAEAERLTTILIFILLVIIDKSVLVLEYEASIWIVFFQPTREWDIIWHSKHALCLVVYPLSLNLNASNNSDLVYKHELERSTLLIDLPITLKRWGKCRSLIYGGSYPKFSLFLKVSGVFLGFHLVWNVFTQLKMFHLGEISFHLGGMCSHQKVFPWVKRFSSGEKVSTTFKTFHTTRKSHDTRSLVLV